MDGYQLIDINKCFHRNGIININSSLEQFIVHTDGCHRGSASFCSATMKAKTFGVSVITCWRYDVT